MDARTSQRCRHLPADQGVAMIMVLGLALTATVIVGAALSYAVSQQPQARLGSSTMRALAAAQAGIDHYLAHLNKDRNYFSTVDCTNPALAGPKQDPGVLNNPCGWNSSTPVGWVPVQPGDAGSALFHYDVDSTGMDQFTIWLASTGRAGSVRRTLQAKISIAGSQRYLYVTDFEDADPENTIMYAPPAPPECGGSGASSPPAMYWWTTGTNKRRSSGTCREISFADGDKLDGPVHFNDMPAIAGSANFVQGFTTYSPACPKKAVTSASEARNKCFRGSGNPSLAPKGARWANFNALPDTTEELVNKPGCQFTGDTRIVFKDDGTMDVWNTMSASTDVAFVGNPAKITSAPNCGSVASYKPATGQKHPAAPQNIPVPDNLVIFVKNAANSSTCVPGQVVNGGASGSAAKDIIPTGGNGFTTDVSYMNPTKVVSTKQADGTWQRVPTGDTHPEKFDCGLGNAYIEGRVKGRVTIAAQNNVVVTGDLTIANTPVGASPSNDASDLVGLVAQNSVVVYHPVSIGSWSVTPAKGKASGATNPTCGSSPTALPSGGKAGASCTYTAGGGRSNIDYMSRPVGGDPHRWIYASIQTLAHSFWVASYSTPSSSLGTLSVRGSIAQRWRGAVGLIGGVGYTKDYSYDKRLQTTSPPYFPPWANGEWAAETTGEIPTPTSIQ